MTDYATIWENCELPSKGMVYREKEVNPHLQIRSMTTAEEMKRLSPTETPYKVMCDIIEDCLKEKPEIPVYQMCIGDYQYLVHRLRVATYGPEYKMLVTCPKCKKTLDTLADLDSIEIKEWDESISNDLLITLPVTQKQIELKFETPASIDRVTFRNNELKRKTKTPIDFSLMFTVCGLINKIDGRVYSDLELQEFVKGLPARDTNYILLKSTELNKKVGLDNEILVTCAQCGEQFVIPFRRTSEFFGPTTDR